MITHKNIFLGFLVLIYWCYLSVGVTIVPSQTIDVIEGRDYLFGLEDDNETKFCNCDYKSDLDDNWTSFYVKKPNNACVEVTETTTTLPPTTRSYHFTPSIILKNIQRASENNTISDQGFFGNCTIKVRNVDDKGPTKWSLKPDDWNGIFNKQVDFKVNFFYAIPLLSKRIDIFEGEDFFQYLNSSLNFESCNVMFNGNTIPLNVESEESKVLITKSEVDQRLSERISSLGRGLCGFKLTNAALTDSLEWTLTGMTKDKIKYRATFDSAISPKIADTILHKKESVEIGTFAFITCGKERETVHFCRLYNPQGMLVMALDKISNAGGVCSYTISPFQVDNYGVWKCYAGHKFTMKTVLYTFEFVEKELPYMTTWVKEKGNHLSIGCQLHNLERTEFQYCKMTSPDQQLFNLKPGSATERYVAIGTDLKKLTCAMEIKLPLMDSENGMWRCETDKGGAFIDVGKHQVVDYPKYSKLTTRIGKKLSILCEVPYYSTFCHIKSPNGTRYTIEDKYESWLGRCSHIIEKVKEDDNGTWTCSFARKNGLPDEEILVEVTIADVLSYESEVKATEDYSFPMLCNSGGLPLRYCQFIDPSGKSYYIDNTVNSTYLSYHGKGLEFGDCGITVIKSVNSDSGTWSCVLQLVNEKKEISARITVEVSPNLLSASNLVLILGLTIGVTAITALFTAIAIRTIRQRKRGRVEISPTQPLHDRERQDDQEDIFSLDPSARSYDNPQFSRDNNHEHQY